jgi:hypothetical protein
MLYVWVTQIIPDSHVTLFFSLCPYDMPRSVYKYADMIHVNYLHKIVRDTIMRVNIQMHSRSADAIEAKIYKPNFTDEAHNLCVLSYTEN